MNYEQAVEYVKKNGITKFIIDTDKWKNEGRDICGKGKIELYFGIDDSLSSFNEDVKDKNMDFGYNFNYEWAESWQDYKGEFELAEPELKRGDMVYVWDGERPESPNKRIFVECIEGVNNPFFSVTNGDEDEFERGEKFYITSWEHCEKITLPILTKSEAEEKYNIIIKD